jgi:hypothetical protein
MTQGQGWQPPHQPQQPWAFPPGQPFPPASPAPKSHAPKIVIGCVIAFVLGILGFGGAVGFSIYKATEPPRTASHAFLGALRKGDYDAAWALTTPGFKANVRREDFEAEMLKRVPEATRSKDTTFSSTQISNVTACLAGELSSGDSVYIRLQEGTRGWQVEDINSTPVVGCDY